MHDLRRLIAVFIAITHLLTAGLLAVASPVVFAQSADNEPPVIEFDRVAQGVLGDSQVFSAMVSDDQDVESVILHYRLGTSAPYKDVEMISLAGTTIYTASVPTAGTEETVLQYYIEARDTMGNRSIQGFAFDPIERQLVPANDLASAATVSAPGAAPTVPGISTRRKVLYGILGVVALGLIAGAAGGSDGGSDNPSADDPGTIPLTITVNPL